MDHSADQGRGVHQAGGDIVITEGSPKKDNSDHYHRLSTKFLNALTMLMIITLCVAVINGLLLIDNHNTNRSMVKYMEKDDKQQQLMVNTVRNQIITAVHVLD